MDQKSLKPVRQRRSYTREFKAELVAQYLEGDESLASLAVDHGMNPNVLHRWVREHERYGKHSLDDLEADNGGTLVTHAPANWIPLNPSPSTVDRQVVAKKTPDKIVDAQQPALANGTIALELAGRGIHLRLQWPSHDATGLAQFARAVLT